MNELIKSKINDLCGRIQKLGFGDRESERVESLLKIQNERRRGEGKNFVPKEL